MLAAITVSTICSLICATVASGKNRSSARWGAFGFFLPLIALIAVLASPAIELPRLIADRRTTQTLPPSTGSRAPMRI